MTDTATPLAALPPAPEPHRPRTLLIAGVLAAAAATMLFAGLIGAFFNLQDAARRAGEAWPPDGVEVPNVPLVVATATLLMSSFTAQWAVAAIRANERRVMYLAIGLTLLFGGAFINAMSFVWSQLGVGAGDGSYGTAMFAVTGALVVAVVAAMLVFLVLGFRSLGGQFGPRNTEFVRVAALVWHAVVAIGVLVWFFVFYMHFYFTVR